MEDPFFQPRIAGKTVYVIGSGFSLPLGLPVIANFIPEGLRLLKHEAWEKRDGKPSQQDQFRRERLGTLVTEMFQLLDRHHRMLGHATAGEPTLEDVFCAVDLFSTSGPAQKGPVTRDRRKLREFVREVCAVGWSRHEKQRESLRLGIGVGEFVPTVPHLHFRSDARPSPNGGKPREKLAGDVAQKGKQTVCTYEAFLSQVMGERGEIDASDDTKDDPSAVANPAIVSLNYDLSLEKKSVRFNRKLLLFYGSEVVKKESQIPPWLVRQIEGTPEDAFVLPVIKLHGSLNWKFEKPKRQVEIMEDSQKPPLILPTWQRDSYGETVFSTLLHEARKHLRRAARIVFIGYSMPPTDRYFRYLLADVLSTPELPAIEICNVWPQEEALRRAREMLGPRAVAQGIRVYSGGLDEYVRARKETNVLEP